MTKLEVFKFAAGVVVGVGTGKIVSGIIRSNVTPKNGWQKFTIVAAGFVIGAMAANSTKNYVDELVNEAMEAFAEAGKNWEDLKRSVAGEY